MQNDTQNIIGVDVGSGSVRAGVFNLRGELLAHATREITLFRSGGNKVEQSSREIWQAVCYCIKTAVANAGRFAVVDRRDRLRCHLLAGGDWR